MYVLNEIFAKIMRFIRQMNNSPSKISVQCILHVPIHNFQDHNVFEGYPNSVNKMSILTS